MTVVLVTGDREWTDGETIERELVAAGATLVIEGEARGTDRLAAQAADRLNVPVVPFPADWERYGRAAGPIRNQAMVAALVDYERLGEDVVVLAFHPDLAKSRGTADCVARAALAGLPVRVVTGSKGVPA